MLKIDKIGELQKDVRDTKRELKEIIEEKETYESKYNDLLESMEMLTLDKEVAEERAENLQQEVNMLKDKIEEVAVDLDILRKEADILNKPPELTKKENEERTPLEVIQLERHNERLKEALLRLRDATAEQENELQQKIKILEQENHELDEYKSQYEKNLERLADAEATIEDLKLQLDDALGAEELVEQLTEKNLNLTERIDELNATVEDLEALKELADELEENHIETEKQLQAEIDHRDMLLREQLERLRANEETTADYEATIQQFRELVTMLQNDLDVLKQKEQTEQSEKQTLNSQSQAMMSLNLQLQNTVMKAQAKAVDIELRKLEVNQANDRLNMIQPYLPDAFFKTENDSISCVLLFKRLEFKAQLIVKHLDQNHPISEKIMNNINENLVTICEIKQRAGWLGILATRFHSFIKGCDIPTFLRMGAVYHDLIGVERRLNAIVESLRTDHVNEGQCLSELQRIVSQLEHLADTYLQQEKNNAIQFFGITRILDLNADRMIVLLTFVRQALDNAVRKEGLVISEGVERMEQNYHEPIGRFIAQAKNSKIIAKKLMRRLEDMFEEAMTLKLDQLHRFNTLLAISSKLCKFCFDTCKAITTYIDTKRGGQEDIELTAIQKIILEKGDEILEMVESSMWESALRNIKSLNSELDNTNVQIEHIDKLDKITTNVAPWTQRASDIKAEVVVNHELERKLQQHNEEIVKLVKDVRLKDQALQESEVKINLLEKRMEMARREAEKIKSLESDLEKALSQEQMYAEAMENLQNEYDTLEAENNNLKKEASKREEKRQSLLRKANFVELAERDDPVQIQEMAGNYVEMATEMETLKASIRYLRAENAQLKSSDFIRSLDLKESLLVDKTRQKDIQRERLNDVARETRMLLKDIRAAGASPKIVRLQHVKKDTNKMLTWQSMKRSPDYQYQAQQSVLYTLRQRSLQLRSKMVDLQITSPNARISWTDNEQKQQKATKKHVLLQQQLGKIKIPRLGSSSSNVSARHCVDIHNATEFKQLHNIFIRT
ncbi:dynein associated protein-domain-containing protein [Mycotypha africana]|uniref:dynein associated protein-domain-containing protein n=1 Tax=Mycotypha africana TaxID=64632 RepID=UPI002301F1D1|nr:dynein associated protein-domain-containing protein [Mycotypha africana]KAI8984000.1 dynein associated protein-domain-containing protein [Mycotypha africana]